MIFKEQMYLLFHWRLRFWTTDQFELTSLTKTSSVTSNTSATVIVLCGKLNLIVHGLNSRYRLGFEFMRAGKLTVKPRAAKQTVSHRPLSQET